MSSTTFMTYLAQQNEVEQQDNIDAIRRCFDGLLAEFPLSYGHWKRYADHEVRHGSLERATEVYERGVKAAAYCVELWSFYAAHAVTHWSAQPEKVRAVFERAVDQVGSDYLADKLWDRYIAFETPHADASATPDHGAVGALFARVLRQPLKALDSYWARLGQLASTTHYAPLATSFLLPTAYYLPLTAHYSLHITHHSPGAPRPARLHVLIDRAAGRRGGGGAAGGARG